VNQELRATVVAELEAGETPHGCARAYNLAKCRCSTCRKYESERQANARHRAIIAFRNGEIDRPHGHPRTAIYYGCTCDECRQAEAERRRKYPRYR
jgi:hypothetical protein